MGTRESEQTEKLLSTMRHELRTPLNQILGYTEMLEETLEDEDLPECLEDSRKILKAARNMQEELELALQQITGIMNSAPAQAALPSATEVPHRQQDQESSPDTEVSIPSLITPENAHILVVDDNEMNRDMLSRRLKRKGYNVSVADGGQAALDAISRTQYHLVLLDIMMPDIDGIEVLKQVRQSHSSSDLPIIMATAKDSSEDIVEALQLGANDYVTKPIDFPVVQARVQTQLLVKQSVTEIQSLASQLEVRNSFIKKTFGRYLSDDIAETLLENPEGLKLGGETREVTILMSDLRGFSSFSDSLEPTKVVSLLNHYLEAMTEIILRYGGTIDEFIGDAILVIFGAPSSMDDHAYCAAACAVEMQKKMASVNQYNIANGLPEIEMGIGINTGQVVVGNIGSQQRAKYGVVGRDVNLAARIESFTLGGQILVTDACLRKAGSDILIKDNSTEVTPKGCSTPITIHSITGVSGNPELSLEQVEEDFQDILPERKIIFSMLDGAHAPDPDIDGKLLRLSEHRAMVSSEKLPGAMTAVKIWITDTSGETIQNCDIYAKVIDSDADKGCFTVHFTATPDGITHEFNKLLA